ncbi:MAG: hypothetical protein L0211_13695 [Planctomycetaceae bacterium]|nr:hypothetical protein [Planctomycetaceae bacterium]
MKFLVAMLTLCLSLLVPANRVAAQWVLRNYDYKVKSVDGVHDSIDTDCHLYYSINTGYSDPVDIDAKLYVKYNLEGPQYHLLDSHTHGFSVREHLIFDLSSDAISVDEGEITSEFLIVVNVYPDGELGNECERLATLFAYPTGGFAATTFAYPMLPESFYDGGGNLYMRFTFGCHEESNVSSGLSVEVEQNVGGTWTPKGIYSMCPASEHAVGEKRVLVVVTEPANYPGTQIKMRYRSFWSQSSPATDSATLAL